INAASLAVMLAGLPFDGPIGAVRLGLIGGQWKVNPTYQDLDLATFDVVVAGRMNDQGSIDILMVEGEAPEGSWERILEYAAMATQVSPAFKELQKKAMRRRIIEEGIRLDGRKPDEIRPITCEVGLVPRAHGSGLFQRGETQVLNVITLGMLRMTQMIDTLDPEESKRYIHNYNFPPFSTGEVGRIGSSKRWYIGLV